MSDVYKDYLHDLGILLKEEALEAKTRWKQSMSEKSKSELFNDGYACAMKRVISLMQQQAEGFQIPLSDLCLEDIDADRDLI